MLRSSLNMMACTVWAHEGGDLLEQIKKIQAFIQGTADAIRPKK